MNISVLLSRSFRGRMDEMKKVEPISFQFIEGQDVQMYAITDPAQYS